MTATASFLINISKNNQIESKIFFTVRVFGCLKYKCKRLLKLMKNLVQAGERKYRPSNLILSPILLSSRISPAVTTKNRGQKMTTEFLS